ncbi:MAG: helix-turn-helix domain-containing protein [archaeon]|nr:hypothetical protein [Nanoarchaeota archaeon]
MEDKEQLKKKKKSLEEAIKEKVLPLISETMEKHWGLVVPKIEEDISDRLSQSKISIHIHFDLTFLEAKRRFKEEFLRRELFKHRGNISNMAKFLGINRRSVHRAIKELGIDVDRLELKQYQLNRDQEQKVNQTIRTSLDQYKGLIQEEKIELIYHDLPKLSRDIAFSLPEQEMTWKQAEHEFETEYFQWHLREAKGNVKLIAKKIKMRPESVSRKLARLGLSRKGF